MRKFLGPMGSVSRVTIESQTLKSNMLGDPSVRVVDVYVPAEHDGQGLPSLVDLVGFTGSGLSHTNWVGFRENLPERLDRLIGEQRMPPVVVAFPDCFTRLGDNQYINSAAMGAWEDFLLHEMLPAIEQRFGCGGTGRRGVFGKSSGGYGAVTHALRHPDIWSAAACHSGDMGFALCYLPDMPAVLRALAGAENSIERWWQQMEAAKKPYRCRLPDGRELAFSRPGAVRLMSMISSDWPGRRGITATARSGDRSCSSRARLRCRLVADRVLNREASVRDRTEREKRFFY